MSEPPLSLSSAPLPLDLQASLRTAFFIRFTTKGRRTGLKRVAETTFVWDGERTLSISGYPGRRDWVANIESDPDLVVHTVEGATHYDIQGRARVIHSRPERTPQLLAFLDHWAARPEAPQRVFRLVVSAIRLNSRLRLPWWGPFYLARRVMDRMPCVEVTLVGDPTRRSTPPPAASRSPHG